MKRNPKSDVRKQWKYNRTIDHQFVKGNIQNSIQKKNELKEEWKQIPEYNGLVLIQMMLQMKKLRKNVSVQEIFQIDENGSNESYS